MIQQKWMLALVLATIVSLAGFAQPALAARSNVISTVGCVKLSGCTHHRISAFGEAVGISGDTYLSIQLKENGNFVSMDEGATEVSLYGYPELPSWIYSAYSVDLEGCPSSATIGCRFVVTSSSGPPWIHNIDAEEEGCNCS